MAGTFSTFLLDRLHKTVWLSCNASICLLHGGLTLVRLTIRTTNRGVSINLQLAAWLRACLATVVLACGQPKDAGYPELGAVAAYVVQPSA